MEMQRLDKIIASTGRWSRREVKDLIRHRLVTVNGIPAASPEEKADPETAEILVKGECITYRRYTWIMLNKPTGYLSATEDGKGLTVLDLLPQELRRQELFPVGRLDKDTEGLLFLTNEGGLAHDLLSPKRHVDKVYYARVEGCLVQADLTRLQRGSPCRTDCSARRQSWRSFPQEKPVRPMSRCGRGSSIRSSGCLPFSASPSLIWSAWKWADCLWICHFHEGSTAF